MNVPNSLSWTSFLRVLVIATGGLCLLIFAFIVLVDPYGSFGNRALLAHVAMDDEHRVMGPGLIHTGRYDSAIIGTSAVRAMSPEALGSALGGRFLNLAMSAAQPWEQFRLAKYFVSNARDFKQVILGFDASWCKQDTDKVRSIFKKFPDWAYDRNALNDIPHIYHSRALKIAILKAMHHLGYRHYLPFFENGYKKAYLRKSTYDAQKAQRSIWRLRPHGVQPQSPQYVPTPAEISSWRFPTLTWIEEILQAIDGKAVAIMIFMPAHIADQPDPGSRAAARETECKSRIADLAARHRAHVIDFRFTSQITRTDTNYWDPIHYRKHIADKIIAAITAAVRGEADDSARNWRLLAAPTNR